MCLLLAVLLKLFFEWIERPLYSIESKFEIVFLLCRTVPSTPEYVVLLARLRASDSVKDLGVEKYYARARELLLEAANRGHPKRRYHLPNTLHKGLAVMKENLVSVSACFPGDISFLLDILPELFLMKKIHTVLITFFVQAAALDKLVAERRPWGRLMRQALDFYIKGHVG